MSYANTCLLVKLTISDWDGFKKDKRASAEVDGAFKTAGGAGNYNKRLLDKSTLQPVKSVIARIRDTHEKFTMPWCFHGMDQLPSKLFFQYQAAMDQLKTALSTQVDNLTSQYPIHVANQRTKLGDLFDAEDYPSADQLRTKFGMNIQIFPMPQDNHFDTYLNSHKDKLKTQLQEIVSQAQRSAVQHLYDRVNGVVVKIHERLSDPDSIFRDSMIENAQVLVNLLPDLNVFDDPALKLACNEIQSKILKFPAQRLRDDPALRKQVADDAFDIVNLLKGQAA